MPSGGCITLHVELLFLDRLFTAAGSSSGLHPDFHDNLYILLRGRKRFRLWSPDQAPQLYTHGHLERVHPKGCIVYLGQVKQHTAQTGLQLWQVLRPPCASLHGSELLGSLQDLPRFEAYLSAAPAEALAWASSSKECRSGIAYSHTQSTADVLQGDILGAGSHACYAKIMGGAG